MGCLSLICSTRLDKNKLFPTLFFIIVQACSVHYAFWYWCTFEPRIFHWCNAITCIALSLWEVWLQLQALSTPKKVVYLPLLRLCPALAAAEPACCLRNSSNTIWKKKNEKKKLCIHEEFQGGNYLRVIQCHKTGLQTL